MQLTKNEIRTLNRARDVLASIEARAQEAGHEAAKEGGYDNGSGLVMAFGRLSQISGDAETAIFRTLNIARSYAHLTILDDDLHNRTAEAVEA